MKLNMSTSIRLNAYRIITINSFLREKISCYEQNENCLLSFIENFKDDVILHKKEFNLFYSLLTLKVLQLYTRFIVHVRIIYLYTKILNSTNGEKPP